MVLSVVDPVATLPQVLVDADEVGPTTIWGIPRTLMSTSPTDAVAVDVAGGVLVVTWAHRLCPEMSPAIAATHAGAFVDDDLVETEPVSGVGEIVTRPDELRP
jgi:hypothetical protein